MTAEVCDLSDLPVDQCACRVHAPEPRAADFEVVHRFTAKFSGTLGCDHWVREGDTIARTMNDEYICGVCAS